VRQATVVLPTKDGKKARPVIQEPKSGATKRTTDLDPATVAELPAHKDRQAFRCKSAAFWQDNDLVFCTGRHVPNTNNFLGNVDAIVAAAVVPEICLHELRHIPTRHSCCSTWYQ
jgi:hypothetical protein